MRWVSYEDKINVLNSQYDEIISKMNTEYDGLNNKISKYNVK